MGEVTALQDVDTYELTDVLQGARPDVLVLVGEHTDTAEVILESVAVRRCGYSLLN